VAKKGPQGTSLLYSLGSTDSRDGMELRAQRKRRNFKFSTDETRVS
jgi:hypothetical protein